MNRELQSSIGCVLGQAAALASGPTGVLGSPSRPVRLGLSRKAATTKMAAESVALLFRGIR